MGGISHWLWGFFVDMRLCCVGIEGAVVVYNEKKMLDWIQWFIGGLLELELRKWRCESYVYGKVCCIRYMILLDSNLELQNPRLKSFKHIRAHPYRDTCVHRFTLYRRVRSYAAVYLYIQYRYTYMYHRQSDQVQPPLSKQYAIKAIIPPWTVYTGPIYMTEPPRAENSTHPPPHRSCIRTKPTELPHVPPLLIPTKATVSASADRCVFLSLQRSQMPNLGTVPSSSS